MLRCSLKFNPQSVIRYQQFALWVKMSISQQTTSTTQKLLIADTMLFLQIDEEKINAIGL